MCYLCGPDFSAGCGRTGTICAIDFSWDMLKMGVRRLKLKCSLLYIDEETILSSYADCRV